MLPLASGLQSAEYGAAAKGGILRSSIFLAIVVGLVAILWPHTAHAGYIDPTTGGLLLQVIFGGVAGIAVLLKVFWYRLASLPSRWRLLFHRSDVASRDVGATDSPSNDSGEK